MPPKTTIEKVIVAKPVRNSLRREIFQLTEGEDFTIREPAFIEGSESESDAAVRVGRKLREKYSRYVTDARQQTGKTYTCNTCREWTAGEWISEEHPLFSTYHGAKANDRLWLPGHYVVTYQIICKG